MALTDPERRREYNRAYYVKNKDARRAAYRAYYQANKDRLRHAQAAWRELNPIRRKEVVARHKYGLSKDERLELFESSDGLCAICYEVPATVIDHDHETGRVRGALCYRCNTGLGHVERMGTTSPSIQEYLSTDWRAA